MARILTGIQSSNIPHLGNLLGAIIPAIEMSKDPANNSIYFIADLHSLTSIKDADFVVKVVMLLLLRGLHSGLILNAIFCSSKARFLKCAS
jgi:tryptophanyl-tRNA synthetase